MTRSHSIVLHVMAAIAAVLVSTSAATAQHSGDVILSVIDDTIVTGFNEPGGPIEPARIWDAEFGDSGFPGFSANPGYDCLPGTFPIGSRVGWNATAGLRVWDGSAFVPAVDTWVEVSFSSLSFVISDGPATGFDLAAQSDGGFHRHINYFLDGVDGLPDPAVFLVELELYSTAGLASSEPVFIVFDHEKPGDVADALAWVETELVGGGTPCPADTDLDGSVGLSDLIAVLAAWGPCEGCSTDVDGNGVVDFTDLVTVLGDWGDCS